MSCRNKSPNNIHRGSLIDDMRLLENSQVQDETPPPGMSMVDETLSPITSDEDLKPSCCKTISPRSPQPRPDTTFSPRPDTTLSPIAKPAGTFGLSRSFMEQSVGGRSVTTPSKPPISPIPQPSRYYSTYEERLPAPSPGVRRKYPAYHSTPISSSFRGGEGIDQSTIWGQNTFDPSTSSDGWSQGVRMDSFNVIRQMTPSPRNVKVPPRLQQSYMVPGPSRIPVHQDRSLPINQGYNERFGHVPYVGEPMNITDQPQTNATFYRSQRPQSQENESYLRQQPQDQRNATFPRPRPQTDLSMMYQSFLRGHFHTPQRPQSAQARVNERSQNATFMQERQHVPQGAMIGTFVREKPYSPQNLARPQSAQARINDTFAWQRPPCCEQVDTSGTVASPMSATFEPNVTSSFIEDTDSGGACNDTCGIDTKNTTIDQSGRDLAIYNPNMPTGPQFDTLLEIRTPRRYDENYSNSPMNLSINVSCADRSIVVTPDKRFNVLDSTMPSCMAPRPQFALENGPTGMCSSARVSDRNARCCQCL